MLTFLDIQWLFYVFKIQWLFTGSNPRGNNAWSVRMPLRTSRISHPPLMGRKPVESQKKKSMVVLLYKREM